MTKIDMIEQTACVYAKSAGLRNFGVCVGIILDGEITRKKGKG